MYVIEANSSCNEFDAFTKLIVDKLDVVALSTTICIPTNGTFISPGYVLLIFGYTMLFDTTDTLIKDFLLYIKIRKLSETLSYIISKYYLDSNRSLNELNVISSKINMT